MPSNTIKGLTVEIGGDTTKLGKALQSVEKSAGSLQKELNQINRQLKFDPTNTTLLAQKQQVLKEVIAQTAEKLSTLKEAEAQVQAQFERGEASEEQVRALQREIISTENKMKSYEKAAEETATAIEQVGDNSDDAANDSKDLATEMTQAGNAANNAAEGFSASKGALAGFIANLASSALQAGISALKNAASSALEVGSSFESSMSEVAAISGATGEDLQTLEKTAREFGATTVFSASEAADALKYMALAGWDTQQSVSALPGILNLAAASGMELASASDMVTDYLSAFSMEAEDAEYFADMLAYAQSNANTTAEQLGEAYKNCAANLNAAGQDVETVTSLLSSMANQGLKSSEAGTALNAIMRDITSSMTDGAIAIGDASVQVQDSEGNYRDLTDILKDVESATSSMGDAERAAALSATFTSDSTKGLNLILNEGVESAESFEKELRNCSGTASKMSSTMNDNLQGDIKEMNSAWEELGITIYNDFEGNLRTAVKTVTSKVIPALTNLSNWASKNLPTIKAGIVGVATAMATYETATLAVKVAQTGLTAAIEGCTAVQKVMNAVAEANPYVLLATAIAGVVTACALYTAQTEDMVTQSKVLTDTEMEQINAAQEAAEAWRETTDACKESADASVSELDHVQTLADELQGLADANGTVKDSDQERAQYILGELNDALGTEYTMTGNVIDQYSSLVDSINTTIEAKKAAALIDAYNEAYTEALTNESSLWEALTAAERDYESESLNLDQIKSELSSLETQRNDLLQQSREATDNALQNQLYNEAVSLDGQIATLQGNLTQEQAIYDQKKATYESCAAAYGECQTTIQQYENAEVAAAQGNYSDVATLLQYKSGAYNAFADTVDSDTADVLNTLAKEATDAGVKAQQTKENYENGVSGYTMAMVQEAQTGYQSALDKFSSAYSDAYGVGSDLGSGIVNGSGSWAERLKAKAKSLITGFISAARKAADSHSPSKKMIALGEDMGEGASIGVDNTTDDVVASAKNQVNATMSAYRAANEKAQKTLNNILSTPSRVQIQAESNNIALSNKLDSILNAIQSGQVIMLDGKTLVGKTASEMDSALGKIQLRSARST